MKAFRAHGIHSDYRERQTKSIHYYEMTDLGYNYTENLYGKEKEFYLYFVNSIIEKPIDWNLYNFNPEYFINYYFI